MVVKYDLLLSQKYLDWREMKRREEWRELYPQQIISIVNYVTMDWTFISEGETGNKYKKVSSYY